MSWQVPTRHQAAFVLVIYVNEVLVRAHLELGLDRRPNVEHLFPLRIILPHQRHRDQSRLARWTSNSGTIMEVKYWPAARL